MHIKKCDKSHINSPYPSFLRGGGCAFIHFCDIIYVWIFYKEFLMTILILFLTAVSLFVIPSLRMSIRCFTVVTTILVTPFMVVRFVAISKLFLSVAKAASALLVVTFIQFVVLLLCLSNWFAPLTDIASLQSRRNCDLFS